MYWKNNPASNWDSIFDREVKNHYFYLNRDHNLKLYFTIRCAIQLLVLKPE